MQTNNADPSEYGQDLLDLHKIFPELKLHEIQDRRNSLVNDPRYRSVVDNSSNGHVVNSSE